eukprot:COSAG01_NODE_4625_length_4865_cov_7.434326_1_plen_73_part_10
MIHSSRKVSCSRQARRLCDPFRSEFRRLSSGCHGGILIRLMRRSIDNVVKTKIIPVIEANCWEFQWCIALREF